MNAEPDSYAYVYASYAYVNAYGGCVVSMQMAAASPSLRTIYLKQMAANAATRDNTHP